MTDVVTPAPAGDVVVPPSAPVPGTTDTPPTVATTDTPPPEGATPEGFQETKEVKKPWYQKKIAEQAYQLRESQRLNDRLLGLVESNRQTEKRTGNEAPKPEQFTSLNDYIDAAVEYKLKSQQPKENVPRETQSDPMVETELNDMKSEGLDKYEDFQETIESDGLKITPIMRNAILEADNRVEVAYFLGKNPKEAARISRLSPVRQVAEIARIEDKLNARPAKPKPSAAPAPVQPVNGSATSTTDFSKISDTGEFIRKRQEKLYGGRRLR